MQTRSFTSRPPLLLLSHRVPHALGGPERARVWQLLRIISQTHDVYLASLHDGPVNLAQWRRIDHHAQRVVLERRTRTQRVTDRALRFLYGSTGCGASASLALSAPVDVWRQDMQFDAVVCTHPALWPLARTIDTGCRLCDLHVPASSLHRDRADNLSGSPLAFWDQLLRLRHDRVADHLSHVEQDIAAEADIVTLARSEDCHALLGHARQALVLPDSVDLAFFPKDAAGIAAGYDSEALRLVYHGDETRSYIWFRDEVWPAVREAVPHAELVHSGTPSQHASPVDNDIDPTICSLRDASVVVSASSNPHRAPWRVMQAMAMERPVVAADIGVRSLGAVHGQHLLMAQRTSDWTQHCIESLRSAQMRLKLAQGARSFIEDRSRQSEGELPLYRTAPVESYEPQSLAKAA